MGKAKDPFAIGLKTVIRNNWESQEKFADGVTSTVNLSNILNDKTGTSRKMKEALAGKAGMTIEDVIALGKEAAIPGGLERAQLRVFDSVADLNSHEVVSNLQDATMRLTGHINQHNQLIATLVGGLLDERNKLSASLYQEQSILNAVPDQIKAVDRNMKICFCNRAATEANFQMVGDDCPAVLGEPAAEGNIARKVFAHGKEERQILETGDKVEAISAFPVFSPSGIVTRIIIIIQDLTPWFRLFAGIDWSKRVS